MSYDPHSDFVAPARAHPQFWRLVMGLLTVTVVFVAVVAGQAGLLRLATGAGDAPAWLQKAQTGEGPMGTLLLLATFLGMMLGAFVAARLWHRRGIATLFGPGSRAHFLRAGLIAVVILVLSIFVFMLQQDTQPGLALPVWAAYLPFALIAVLIQTGAEEVLFRGYLQQQLAARFRSPLIWMVLPSLSFGLLHFDLNADPATAGLVFLATFLFGLCAADLTARTGSIGAAWGFHFANNLFAILVIAPPDSLSGLALFQTTFTLSDGPAVRPMILQDIAFTLAIWVAIRTQSGRSPA